MVKPCFYTLRIISGKQSRCLRKQYKYTALKVWLFFSVILFLFCHSLPSMPSRRCMLAGKTKWPNESKSNPSDVPVHPFDCSASPNALPLRFPSHGVAPSSLLYLFLSLSGLESMSSHFLVSMFKALVLP